MRFLVRLPIALWVERRRRKRVENHNLAWALATFWLGQLYVRYGSDEQVEDWYEIMQNGLGARDPLTGERVPYEVGRHPAGASVTTSP